MLSIVFHLVCSHLCLWKGVQKRIKKLCQREHLAYTASSAVHSRYHISQKRLWRRFPLSEREENNLATEIINDDWEDWRSFPDLFSFLKETSFFALITTRTVCLLALKAFALRKTKKIKFCLRVHKRIYSIMAITQLLLLPSTQRAPPKIWNTI